MLYVTNNYLIVISPQTFQLRYLWQGRYYMECLFPIFYKKYVEIPDFLPNFIQK